MISENEKGVYDVLKALNISYTRYAHIPVYTVDEAKQLDVQILGQHCKNLFIRNRKGDIHYLLILLDHKKADLKCIAEQIKSTPLSLASEERLYKYLGLTPGSVTAFGLINNVEKNVQVLLDSELDPAGSVCFHPNINSATITLAYKDFERYLQWCGNQVTYVQVL